MTSYHNVNLATTPSNLMKALGEDKCLEFSLDSNTEDKVQVEFEIEFVNEFGDTISGYIYSWKEHRELNSHDVLNFNIGSKSGYESTLIKEYVINLLK